MLSAVLDHWKEFNYREFFDDLKDRDILSAIGKTNLSEFDFLSLLSPRADSFLEEMAVRASEITERQFGKTINLYTPLYLSDYCQNHCLYCGFNCKQDLNRRKLSADEIKREGEKISRTGLQHILLLTGGDRDETPPSYIAEAVRVLKPLFASISIEVYALRSEEYEELHRAGVDHVTIYQETYDRDLYGKLHLAGEKKDYDFRLNAPERAARQGMHSLNLGVLLGLGDPVADFFLASLHCDYLRKNYPSLSVAMSFPRIRPAAGGFKALNPVGDRELVKFMLAYRLFLPRGEISISTRESAEFRNNLLPLGVTKMSAESCTSVGGRTDDREGHEQFSVDDRRTVSQLDGDLRKAGYQPVYRDWVRV